MNFDDLSNNKGQTAVEYLFLIAVLAIILISLLPVVTEKLIGNGNCRGQDQDKLLCQLLNYTALGQGNNSGFRRYTLLR